MKGSRNLIGYLLRAAVAVVLLTLLISRAKPGEIGRGLASVDVGMFILALAVAYLVQFVMALQRKLVLHRLGLHFSVWSLVKIQLISLFYGVVVPGGAVAGGVASYVKLAQGSGKRTGAAAAVVFFRVLNLVLLFMLGCAGTLLDTSLAIPQLRLVSGLLAVAGCVGMLPVMVPLAGKQVLRLTGWIASRAPRLSVVDTKLRQLMDGFHSMTTREIAGVVVTGVLINFLIFANWYFYGKAAGLTLGFWTMCWVGLVQTILEIVPTIAGLGVRESSLVWLLGYYGVAMEKALVFGFVVFFALMISTVVGGLLEFRDQFLKRRISPQADGQATEPPVGS